MSDDIFNQYWFHKRNRYLLRILDGKIELIILLIFCSLIILTIDFLLDRNSYYITIITIYMIWFSCSTLSFWLIIFGALIQFIIPQQNYVVIDNELPLYTIILPLYNEAGLVPQLLKTISLINYPVDKLQILFVTESDDTETISAYKQSYKKFNLPLELVIVPYSLPRTKPKA